MTAITRSLPERFSILAITNFGNSGNLVSSLPVIFQLLLQTIHFGKSELAPTLDGARTELARPLVRAWAVQAEYLGPSSQAEGRNQSRRGRCHISSTSFSKIRRPLWGEEK
jgi:hypothetical protein